MMTLTFEFSKVKRAGDFAEHCMSIDQLAVTVFAKPHAWVVRVRCDDDGDLASARELAPMFDGTEVPS